eukprot:Amastigsp_a3480_70.p5 type:complete len:119 gc:universal Amastigsp_a3480_70:662-306(-)
MLPRHAVHLDSKLAAKRRRAAVRTDKMPRLDEHRQPCRDMNTARLADLGRRETRRRSPLETHKLHPGENADVLGELFVAHTTECELYERLVEEVVLREPERAFAVAQAEELAPEVPRR